MFFFFFLSIYIKISIFTTGNCFFVSKRLQINISYTPSFYNLCGFKANLMEIKSKQENFRLREWKLTDIVSLVKHINNEKIWNNVRDGLPYPYTMLDADKYIRMVQAQPYVQNFAIEVAGEAVGGVGIVPLTDVERFSAEVGYWLGEDYWGRGITSEAVALLVDYVFRKTEIIRLFASVYEYNPASMKVLEKVGFTRQAILRDAAIKNGRVIDMYYYDLIKREI